MFGAHQRRRRRGAVAGRHENPAADAREPRRGTDARNTSRAGQELQEKDWGFYIFAAGVCAFFAAYGIGANDVANCFATSVGSKALTVKQAVVIASVCEFFGALLMGSNVTNRVEINQYSSLGDDVAALVPSSGEEPASPRHRTGVASMAWRSTRLFRTNSP